LYNRALSASEIALIYSADAAGKHLPTGYEQWKLTFLGDINAPDSGDADGDGLNNLAEYIADTNPTNANSNLRITSITPVPGGTAFEWEGGLLSTQFLQCSFGLDPAHGWVNILTNAPPTPSPFRFTNSLGTNAVQFYRLRVLR